MPTSQKPRWVRWMTKLSAVFAAAVVAGSAAGPAVEVEAASEPVGVQVLNITDLHGYLSETENQRISGPDGTLDVGGAGYLAAHLDRLRAGQENSFLIGSGDQFSGWPDYTQAFANEPTIEVLNAMGMDFDVAGNHEFDREFPFLRRMMSGACYGKSGFDSCFTDSTGHGFHGTDYRYHAANIVDPESKKAVLPSYWITSVPNPAGGSIKVGFIGLALPGTPHESLSIGGSSFEFQAVVDAANRAADELKRKGVDAIVASMHEGGQHDGLFNECKNPRGPIFDAARDMSPDVDAILGGHWHTSFTCMVPDPNGDPRPVIEAANHGKLIGEVNLSIDPESGDVIRDLTRAANHPVTKDITPDAAIEKTVSYWMERWTQRQGEPLSTIDQDLEFSTTEESRMGNLVADLYHAESQKKANGDADLALVPPEIGIDVVSSGLTYGLAGHPADRPGRVLFGEAWPTVGISPITTVSLRGDEVDSVLEQQWLPPAYGCQRSTSLAVSENVRYTYDMGAPAGQRARDIQINGAPLDPDRTYRVATTSILLIHGAQYGYPTFEEGRQMVRAPRMGQEVFLNHLRTHQQVAAPSLGRIERIPGTPPPVEGPFGPLTFLPQHEMTATATSRGNAAHDASAALDGKCSTMWHSSWSPPAPLPQSITLDMGRTRAVEALVYTPRQDADVPNGRISSYDVQVSDDGSSFGSVSTGTWDGTVDAKIASFPAGTEARYIRLIGLEGGAGYAAATELNVALSKATHSP